MAEPTTAHLLNLPLWFCSLCAKRKHPLDNTVEQTLLFSFAVSAKSYDSAWSIATRIMQRAKEQFSSFSHWGLDVNPTSMRGLVNDPEKMQFTMSAEVRAEMEGIPSDFG